MRDYGREQYEALRDDPPMLNDYELSLWLSGSGIPYHRFEELCWLYDGREDERNHHDGE